MSTAEAVAIPAAEPQAAQRDPDNPGPVLKLAAWLTPDQGWDTFLMLLGLVLLATFTVVEADWVDTPGILWIVLLSCVAGLVLSKVRAPWPLLHLAGLGLGFAVVAYQASSITQSASLDGRMTETWNRLKLFYEAATTGGISTDLLPFTLMMLTMAWLLGYLGSWYLFRLTNLWVPLILAALAILTNLSYLPTGYESRFFGFMAIAMLLVARITLIQRREQWAGSNVEFDSTSGWLGVRVALVISALVLLAAANIPLRIYVSNVAIDVWNLARSPLAEVEDEFARLFSGIASRKDLTGRFFGKTLPFQGKISFGGEIVLWASTEQPSYWLSRTYSEYSSQGWIAGDTNAINVGPESLPPPPSDTLKRVPTFQGIHVTFETDNLFSGGGLDWVSREAVLETLKPLEFKVKVGDDSGDKDFPKDVQTIAAEIRHALSVSNTPFVESQISRILPTDMVIVSVSPGSEVADRRRIDEVVVARKEPTSPDVVSWQFVDRVQADDAYAVRSALSVASGRDLRGAGEDYPGFVTDHYLQLPSTVPDRVHELAKELTQGAETPYDAGLAVQTYLRDNFVYSQDIDKPSRNKDGVDYFLFDTRTGYSDYFASSMAVMLRSVGIPARLAAGYGPGEPQGSSGRSAVKDSGSHGWVQVYFPSYGWIDFEPTPNWPILGRGGSEAGDESESDEPLGAGEAVSEEIQAGDGCDIGDDPLFDEDCVPIEGLSTSDFLEGETAPASSALLLAIVVGAGVAISTIWLLAWLLWTMSLANSTPAESVYTRMNRLGALAGLRRDPNQTPLEYAAALGRAIPAMGPAARTAASLFAAGRYGMKEPTEPEEDSLGDTWKTIRGNLLAKTLRRLVPVGQA